MAENEISFNGKKYISSKRASEISGYAKDYIGQLCRGNEIKCQRVGRGWFVSADDLLLHIKKSPRRNHKKLNKEIIQISSKKARLFSFLYSLKPSGPVFDFSECKDFLVPVLGLVLLIVGIAGFSASGRHIENIALVATFKMAENLSPELIPKILSKTNETINKTGDWLTDFSINLSNKTIVAVNKISQISLSNLVTNIVKNTIESAEKIFSLLFPPEPDKNILSYVDEAKTKEGLVVIPSTGSESSDEKIKQKVKKTFSDEVIVKPDTTGMSGVIKPVFKYTEGDNYLYILVPIKE